MAKDSAKKKKTPRSHGSKSGKKKTVRKSTSKKTAKPKARKADSVASLREQLEEKVDLLSTTNRQLKRKIFDLYTIFEISRNFNAVLDYYSLVDSFIFTCLGQVGAVRGTLFLKRDGESDRFYVAKSKGSGATPSEDMYFSERSRLMTYLARLNRPVLVTDLLGDLSADDEKVILDQFKTGIVVPLIYQTHLTGIFIMDEKISGREFTVDDIEFLSILGNQISVAIENARLYEAEKRATRQLRAAQQQLLQSERLAALGDMSAKVAHEVNNPLGIIKNYLLLIQRSLDDDSMAQEHTRVVSEEINRIARIVKQLLDFHRPQAQNLQPLDLAKVLDETLVIMERQLVSRKIELERNYTLKEPCVLASADNLKQVFLNLIINARDAMPDGGKLTVSVRQEGDHVLTTFSDTGPGIPADVVPRIFEPFFTTKESGEGTGLGLSVCYGIIKAHSGSIEFTNLEPGSCFEIRLPLLDESDDERENC